MLIKSLKIVKQEIPPEFVTLYLKVKNEDYFIYSINHSLL